MEVASVQEIYQKAGHDSATVFIAPLIPQTDTNTSYLYQLYAPLLDEASPYTIRSISYWGHLTPFIYALFSRKIIFHYHWVEFQHLHSLAGLPFKLMAVWLFRMVGGTLVWTFHNEKPHLGRFPKLHKRIYQWMFKKSNLLHVHCQSSADSILNESPAVSPEKVVILKHPMYPAVRITKEEAYQRIESITGTPLNPALPVWLIFGQISPYKQIPQLIKRLMDIAPPVQLIIAGTIKRDGKREYQKLVKLMELNPDFMLIPRWVSDSEVQTLFSLADLCLFNHREIFASGGMYLARSYDVPIVAPYKGCIIEQGQQAGVHLFRDNAELESLIRGLGGNSV